MKIVGTQKATDSKLIWVIFSATAFIVFVFFSYWGLVYYLAVLRDVGWAKTSAVGGTFGDFIGGVIGTILNFTGVLLLYLTFRAQINASNLQQFESTFFSLLSNQRDIVEKMSFIYPRYTFTVYSVEDEAQHKEGRRFIQKVVNELESNLEQIPDGLTKGEVKDFFRQVYSLIYEGKEDELDHYFRHLYHIVKYTHNAPIENKRKYIDIVQAQMSDNELFLAFCNGLSKYGEKFYPLMEEYQFTENVRNRRGNFKNYKEILYPNTFLNKK